MVSVVMPVYNGFPLVVESLECLQGQDYENLEIIVIDDGSDESQEDLVRSRFNDPRAHFFRQENQGPGLARLNGLAQARGEFFQLIDQDDLISPNKIAMQVDFLQKNPAVDMTYTDHYFIHEENGARRVFPSPFRGGPSGSVLGPLLRQSFFCNEGALARRSLLDGVEIIDLPGNRWSNDWHFWIQILIPGRRVAQVSLGKAFKRVHGGCTSIDSLKIVEWRCRIFGWLEERFKCGFPADVTPRHIAEMELEWAKDCAVLGGYTESLRHLIRGLVRSPRAALSLPDRALLPFLLPLPLLGPWLLAKRLERDPYVQLLDRSDRDTESGAEA